MRYSIFILLLSALTGYGQGFGQSIAFQGAAAIRPAAGGGGSATYVLSEDFEGAGAPSGWSTILGTSPNYDNTTNVLAGSESLALPVSTVVQSTNFTADLSTVWVYFMVKPSALKDGALCQIYDTGGDMVAQAVLNADGTLSGSDSAFHSGTTVATMSAGTTYHVWLKYVKGTGANQVTTVWFNTSATLPTGNNSATNSAGIGTLNARSIYLWQDSGAAAGFIYDKVRADDVEIGSNPD